MEGLDFKKQRKIGKAAILPTAPAYTWGKSRERVRDDPGPGPGEYYPQDLHAVRRGGGFGSSTRYKAGSDEVPGPGNYGVPFNPMSRSYPAFTFRGVTPRDSRAFVPGPGTYDAALSERLSMRSSSGPSYSIAFKCEDPAMRERRPGPQAYHLKLEASKPAVSLKFRHDGSSNGRFTKDPGPGPMEYSDRIYLQQIHCPGSSTKKGFSFGLKTKIKTTSDVTPGPQYKIGVTTLGIAAAVPMTDDQLNQIAVL